jgi:hypothetical protein
MSTSQPYMMIGTSHFRSLTCAARYYAPYECSRADVEKMVANGEIEIGAPTRLKSDESFAWDRDGRGQISVYVRKAS